MSSQAQTCNLKELAVILEESKHRADIEAGVKKIATKLDELFKSTADVGVRSETIYTAVSREWLTMSNFNTDILLAIINKCFISESTTLTDLNDTINKVAMKADFDEHLTKDMLDRYEDAVDKIKEIFSYGNVETEHTDEDVFIYLMLTNRYDFTYNNIATIAKAINGTSNIMSLILGCAIELSGRGVSINNAIIEKYVEDKTTIVVQTAKTARPKIGNDEHIYTEEEYNAIFTNIDDLIVGLTDEDL
jgi:lambda repressor-like predicted transcriptional regulator